MKLGKQMLSTARKRMGRAGSVAVGMLGAPVLSHINRTELLESSQDAALADPRFRQHVERGDRARDQQNWAEAEAAYSAALDLYPYERSYWIQRGHMAKEQMRFVPAEIAYRTACAFGAPRHDVDAHLRFVLARQKLDESRYPIRYFDALPQPRQVPGCPDVLAFARLLWGVMGMDDVDLVVFMRTSASIDELVAAMIRDARFERANRPWLETLREGEL